MTRPDTSAEAVRDLENRLLGPMPCAADGGSDKALAMGAVVQGPSDVMLAMAMLRAMLQERDESVNAARVCKAMIQARGTNRDYQQARAEKAEAQLADMERARDNWQHVAEQFQRMLTTARAAALREAAAAIKGRQWDANFAPWEVVERAESMILSLIPAKGPTDAE